LVEVSEKIYKHYFSNDPHPYVSEGFVELNKDKADRIVHLLEDKDKVSIGLVAGIKEGILKSPFSAPFGGFHFRSRSIYISEIENYLRLLKEYAMYSGLARIEIILPPDIYHHTFNAKTVVAFLNNDFCIAPMEVTNWLNLRQFTGKFKDKKARTLFNQAMRNELSFYSIDDDTDKNAVFETICQNRKRFGRPIYMTLHDLDNTGELWPVDYFSVADRDGNIVAGAIFYRAHPTIVQAVFWGDGEQGRQLRGMDFLASELWNHYKKLDYDYIDLGISTESGNPNEGLLRFKETHDATSALRYGFYLDVN
ncbi:hypothetical protein OAT93_00395, partial [bacterium]|nr:hypothetical protein [bacterium]